MNVFLKREVFLIDAVHFAIILHKSHFYDSTLLLSDQPIDRSQNHFTFHSLIQKYTNLFPPADVTYAFYYHLLIQNPTDRCSSLTHLLTDPLPRTDHIEYLAGRWDLERAERHAGVIEQYLGRDAAKKVCDDAAESEKCKGTVREVKLLFVCENFRGGLERLNWLIVANVKGRGGASLDAGVVTYARVCYNFFYFRAEFAALERGVITLGVLLRLCDFF